MSFYQGSKQVITHNSQRNPNSGSAWFGILGHATMFAHVHIQLGRMHEVCQHSMQQGGLASSPGVLLRLYLIVSAGSSCLVSGWVRKKWKGWICEKNILSTCVFKVVSYKPVNFVQRTIKIHEVESANYELQVSKQWSAQDVLRVIWIVDSMAVIKLYIL